MCRSNTIRRPNERSNAEVHLNQLDEPIEIEAYNPALETVFLSAAKALRTRLGALALGIEHIGSTAVPGLRGKPVVDIMLGVGPGDLQEEKLRSALDGYESLGEAGVPGRLHFRRRKTEAINVHAVEYGGKLWIDNVLLRDYLQAHPDEAERYGRIKDKIVEGGNHTLLLYSRAKHEMIQDLLANARAWKYKHNLSNHT